MGTISEKLTYLNTTKQKLKDSINALGGDITSETTFRNYATELDNIYSSLPKTTGEGSNLSLSPTLKGKLNIEAYKGDTEQDTTTGYNILNFNSYVALEDNILSTNSNRGQVLASDIQLQANTTYYFKFILIQKPTTSTTITSYIDGTPDTTIGQINIQGYSVGTLVTKQITPTSNCVLSMAIWGNANTETIKFQYWLTTDNTKDTFEPYTNGASPNPTYPQDINVVTGTQEVVVCNKNLFDKNNANILNAFVDGSSGLLATPTNNQKSIAIAIQPSTQYTISGIERSSSNYGLFSDTTLTIGTSIANTKGNINNGTMTFTSGANDKWLVFLLGGGSETYGYNSVQLELGSTSTDFVEHQEQTQALHLGDIELAKIGTYVDRIYKNSDKWYIEKNIGKAVFSNFTWNAIPTGITNIYRFTTTQIPNVKYVATNRELGNALSTCYAIHTGDGMSNAAYYFCIDVSMVQATDDSTLTTPRGEMYYALATPTYEEITNETLIEELNELEKMMSYSGQTNISVSGNLPMILSVSALKGE